MWRLKILLVGVASALRGPVTSIRTNRVLNAAGDWAEARAAAAAASKNRVVMKFGGSSVANAERIEHVAKLIASRMDEGIVPTIVLSAMGKTTNEIEAAGRQALAEGRVRIDHLRALARPQRRLLLSPGLSLQ